ncbi:ubiquinone/menaquinone biosynthesis C-methylase UbiE [Paenibacillus endophyticus]|uniref:Ubiquinone/menaquinone biosynthesis C-methylase UbiE n=1 Tax=Paenibacillus endophyticus TaxID=1294268 RepID=A0A7W5C8T0_9BACL|nr:class I SAM-dependent methyltransferase [Paenibacillus endophyticus]MBB3153212.1 ubiquinone/menaquinone biosynthesis C-methylase UbiE [Paenibacillus endophyticus]
MTSGSHSQNNVDRFSGFENDYDQHRPKAPQAVIDILTGYLGRTPSLVADVGCGTGLSSYVWLGHADRIIGFEPNDDMRGKAISRLPEQGGEASISFVKGYSDKLSLDAESVDVLTCSQSFHWMEPVSTLREFARVLKPEGIFAAYDCDWPPTLHWAVEAEYKKLIDRSEEIINKHVPEKDRASKRDKEKHLTHIHNSGLFRFSKEIVFHNLETCDAKRYVGLVVSQGGIQTVFKLGSTELEEQLRQFQSSVEHYFAGRSLDVRFSYRMRLGVK